MRSSATSAHVRCDADVYTAHHYGASPKGWSVAMDNMRHSDCALRQNSCRTLALLASRMQLPMTGRRVDPPRLYSLFILLRTQVLVANARYLPSRLSIHFTLVVRMPAPVTHEDLSFIVTRLRLYLHCKQALATPRTSPDLSQSFLAIHLPPRFTYFLSNPLCSYHIPARSFPGAIPTWTPAPPSCLTTSENALRSFGPNPLL